MSSAGSTQQPDWRTLAQPRALLNTEPTPHPYPYPAHAESFESAGGLAKSYKSNVNWSLGQGSNGQTLQTIPESPTRPGLPKPSSRLPAMPQSGPSATAKWKTETSSPSSLHHAPPSDPSQATGEGAVDELVSEPSSLSRRMQKGEGESGPVVSTPEDDTADNPTAGPSAVRNPTNLDPTTPSKYLELKHSTYPSSHHRPLSALKPILASPSKKATMAVGIMSPSKLVSPTRTNHIQLSSRPEPSSHRSRADSSEEESFGAVTDLAPRLRLARMMEPVKEKSRTFWSERGAGVVESRAEAKYHSEGSASHRASTLSATPIDSYRPSSPTKLGGRLLWDAEPSAPLGSTSGVAPVDPAPSIQPTISPRSLVGVQHSHFSALQPSSGNDLPVSPLFSHSQEHEFGSTPRSHPQHVFQATQIIEKVEADDSEEKAALEGTMRNHIVENSSAPGSTTGGLLVETYLAPSYATPPRPARLVPPVDPTGQASSQTSNSTNHTTIPSHRRLGRVNPRVVDPVPMRSHVDHQSITLPPAIVSTPALQPPRSAPTPGGFHGEIEPTFVDQSVRLDARQTQQLQDTYIDNVLMTSPVSAGPTPRVSSALPSSAPLTSPPALQYSSPLHPATELQPTFVDPKTLPTQPPPPAVTLRQYGRQKRPYKESLESAEAESSGNDDDEAQVIHVGSRRRILSPVQPSSLPAAPLELPETLPPRRRGKRRASHSSDFTSNGGGSDSSPAPEDPEDFTYRPAPKVNGKAPIRAANVKEAKTTRVNSKDAHPAPKRVKLHVSTTPSTRSENLAKDERESSPSSPLTPIASPPKTVRVLGWWGPMRAYFPGTVTRLSHGKYHVDFDDGTSKDLTIDRLRRLELRKGDQVKVDEELVGKGVLEVAEDWRDVSAVGNQGVQVKQDGEPIGLVSVTELYITDAVIRKHFEDRRVSPSDLGAKDDIDGVELAPSPSKVVKMGDVFAGKIFLLTVNGTLAAKEQEAIASKIKRFGGRVVDDWPRLFDLPKNGFGSNLKVKDAPFLIVIGGEGLKPKAIAALASGIPCLASAFIEDAIERDVDWRAYLISPGPSKIFNHRCSQLVDPNWGGADWSSAIARSLRQPFKGMEFLFLVPPGDSSILSTVRELVPFCLSAMGASNLKSIVSTSTIVNLSSYDIVLIESRCPGQIIPELWKSSGKLCNFGWLKQCIISGAKLPAEVVAE